MLVLKRACPNCTGDLYQREDHEGRYLLCGTCWWVSAKECFAEKREVRITAWYHACGSLMEVNQYRLGAALCMSCGEVGMAAEVTYIPMNRKDVLELMEQMHGWNSFL